MLQGMAFLALSLWALWLSLPATADEHQKRQSQWELSVINGLLVFKQQTTSEIQLSADKESQAPDSEKRLQTSEKSQSTPLILTSEHNDFATEVSGIVARSTLIQRFRNPGEKVLQGRYQFPLPEDAAVDSLIMRIGKREIVGVVKEKRIAEATFRQAQQQGQRASMVSQQRANLFSTELANIGPHEEVEIEIQFQQRARYVDGEFRLRLPTTFIPRFGASDLEASGIASENLPRLDMKFKLHAQRELAYLESPHFPVHQSHDSNFSYDVKLKSPAIADRDMELVWRYQNAQPEVLHYREALSDGEYGLLMVLPGQQAHQYDLVREVTLVIDTSSSMGGQAIEQAKKALLLAIDELTEQDAFNIIEFNSSASALWNSVRPVNARNRQSAKDFVKQLKADGGTNIYEAFDLALLTQQSTEGLRQVVFVTDGAIGYEDSMLAEIQSRLGATRLFTVGIGAAPNSYFMVQAAQLGRGTYTYISSPQQIEQRMQQLLRKLALPALTDLTVYTDTEAEIYPGIIPDLYQGEPIVIAYKAPSAVSDVRFSGRLGDSAWQQTLELDYLSDHSGIAKYWAREKIQDLLGKQRLMSFRDKQSEQKFQQNIVRVALQHQLVSPYTSLIAIDPTFNTNLNKYPLLAQMPSTSLDTGHRFLLSGMLLLMAILLTIWHWFSIKQADNAGASHVAQ